MSHGLGGDLDELPGVTIVGLCIGYPLWSVGVAVTSDRLAAHLMRLDVTPARRADPPRRVTAWTPPPAPAREPGSSLTAVSPAAAPRAPRGALDRLTARQLQVVALLRDGMRYAEVASCLSISTRQVQRHVAQAVARLGVRNAYELVAVAVTEGLVPPPASVGGRPPRRSAARRPPPGAESAPGTCS